MPNTVSTNTFKKCQSKTCPQPVAEMGKSEFYADDNPEMDQQFTQGDKNCPSVRRVWPYKAQISGVFRKRKFGLKNLEFSYNPPRDENKYLERVFHKTNYNADFIKRATLNDAANRNPAPVTKVVAFTANG